MAKSVRSKSKRHFRAIKRKKCMTKLKEQIIKTTTLNLKNVNAPYVCSKFIKEDESPNEAPKQLEDTEMMCERPKKPLMNEHGCYPVWLNKRELKRQVRAYRRKKNKKTLNGSYLFFIPHGH